MNQATRNRSEELHCSYSINLEDAAPKALEEANQKEHLKPGFHIGENTKRGALLHGVPYGVPKMEYP